MKSHKTLPLAIVVVFLFAPLGIPGSFGVPTLAQEFQPGDARTALEAAIADYNSTNADFLLKLLTLEQTTEWAVGYLGYVDPQTGREIPTESSVALAHRNEDGNWQAILPIAENAIQYNDWLTVLDSRLLSTDIKNRLRFPSSTSQPQIIATATGYEMPWAGGWGGTLKRRHDDNGADNPNGNNYDFDLWEGSIPSSVSKHGYIAAAKAGTIVYVKEISIHDGCNDLDNPCDPSRANVVVIQHSPNEFSWYYHLMPYSVPYDIVPGKYVEAGTIIGQEGNTGWSTNVHLHFMVSDWITSTIRMKTETNPDFDPWPTGHIIPVTFNGGIIQISNNYLPTANAVILYWDADYKGPAVRLTSEDVIHNCCDFLPWFNDRVSSVKVYPGFIIKLFEHFGRNGGWKVFSVSDSNFSDDTFNNSVAMNDQVTAYELTESIYLLQDDFFIATGDSSAFFSSELHIGFDFINNLQSGTLTVARYIGSPSSIDGVLFPDWYWDISATFPDGTFLTNIVFQYNDNALINSGLIEDFLTVYYDSGNGWTEAVVTARDPQANTITVETDHVSKWVLGSPASLRPELAYVENGTLILNMGSEDRRNERLIQKDEVNEEFVVRQLTPNLPGEFSVTAFGVSQVYSDVVRVWAYGDDGNDAVSLKPGVDSAGNPVAFTAPAEINGGSGGDQIQSGDGADTLSGGSGDDEISGGGGSDTITGDSGNDHIEGGGGDDDLSGGGGSDTINGDSGNDHIQGGDNNDDLHGGDGGDTINGESGNDHIEGGDGDDDLSGDGGMDTIHGDSGDDHIQGGDDNDDLHGGSGGDTINGDSGDDRIEGDDGDDFLYGDETLTCDADGFILNAGSSASNPTPAVAGPYVIYLGLILNNASPNQSPAGPGGSDEINGGTGNDHIFGGGQADILNGNDSDDEICGNGGNDKLSGNAGNDSMHGGSGDDHMEGNDGADTMRGDAGSDDMQGQADADEMYGDGDRDTMYGNAGNDMMHGGADDDYMEGNPDDDTMYGDDGQDDVIGGTSTAGTSDGQDTLYGGADHDVMVGDNASIVRPLNGDQRIRDTFSADAMDVVRRTIELFDVATTSSTPPAGAYGGDQMYGEGGHDIMYGQGGNDAMSGGPDEDYMEGNAGGDTMYGDAGQDDMLGGTGRINDDPLQGVNGRLDGDDQLYGESDTSQGLTDGDGADVMLGDNGIITRPPDANGAWQIRPANGAFVRVITLLDVETLTNSVDPAVYGDDTMYGNDNDDTLYGQGGEDQMHGGAGDDYMEGNATSDMMYGDGGDDDMLGGTGPTTSNDPSTALPGRVDSSALTRTVPLGADPVVSVPLGDVMDGGEGSDVMLGDNGIITRPVDEAERWILLNYALLGDTDGEVAPRHTTSGSGSRVDRRVQFLDPEPGLTSGSDLMDGGPGDDDIYGQFDDTNPSPAHPAIGDEMRGNEGEDAMVGDLGIANSWVITDDTQTIEPPEPFIDDVIFVHGTLFRQVTLQQLETGGDDRMLGGPGGDWMHGGAGHDLMNGNSGNDRLFGDNDRDVMWGGPHHDHLWGGDDDDYLDVKPRLGMTIGNGKQGKGNPRTILADPLEWFLYGEEDNFQDIDYIYGGWDQDAMQADVADTGPVPGDRLIDWVGAYNVYYLCPPLYGEYVITRDHSPHMVIFLQDLAAGDGAVDTAVSGSSGFNEIAIVFSRDIQRNSHPPHPDNPGHFTCDQTP